MGVDWLRQAVIRTRRFLKYSLSAEQQNAGMIYLMVFTPAFDLRASSQTEQP